MSRIGNKPVEIPAKVKVNIDGNGKVAVEGPKGKLDWTLPKGIKASVADNEVSLVRDAETRSVKALHGISPTSRPRSRGRISISASDFRIQCSSRFRQTLRSL